MVKFRFLGWALLLLAWAAQASAQFARTEHKQIVDGGGPSGLRASKPLLVRATNLGNWMVPEGYMWLFQGGPQSPSEIRALVLELLGPEGAAAFWQKWRGEKRTAGGLVPLHPGGGNAHRRAFPYCVFFGDDPEGVLFVV